MTIIPPAQIHASLTPDLKSLIFDALVTQTETEVYHLCKEKGICEERDSFLYDSSSQMYVPDNDSLHMKVISSHHNSPVTSHLGYQKTQELIEHQYYWPRLASDVKEYVSRCNQCTHFKGSNMKPASATIPLQPSTMPWVDVSVDFITNLPLSNSYNSILTVVNCFSKETEFILCNKTTMALDTAKLYLFHVWKDHGLPHTIISDCRPQFTLQVMMDLCKQLNITAKHRWMGKWRS